MREKVYIYIYCGTADPRGSTDDLHFGKRFLCIIIFFILAAVFLCAIAETENTASPLPCAIFFLRNAILKR